MRPDLGVELKRGSLIDPAIEKYLLALHAAMDLESFWKSARDLIDAAIPNQIIGLTLQHSPILPLHVRWTSPMPSGFFVTRPLKKFLDAHPRKKIVSIADLFSDRTAFARSTIYRRYIAPQKCARAICLLFWQQRRLSSAMVIMRTSAQSDLSPVKMKLLRQLYQQFSITFRRLRSLERERAVRVELEEFVRRLPLPTMLLRWNLRLLFQNPAARDFCATWEKGFKEARLTNARSAVPAEILNGCRLLRQQWLRSHGRGVRWGNFESKQVRHATSQDLRATIHLKHLNDAVARPHFLIECVDSRRLEEPSITHLPHLTRLTAREQEVTRLVCNGQSNQEIADTACLSVPTVKKHLYAVFRKLEVSSRSQLMALML
ncbi:MAG TPA: helix-turn-helix transcriptional regulator [Chthoniobacterales bacterium]|nr:helix-turn-helix transcriptional regulator [Chthoniobacterales bacterium]